MDEKSKVELTEKYYKLKHVLNYDEKKRIRQLIGLELPDFINWIETEFYIPETRKPMELYWLQKAAIKEAMRTDDNGNFVYSTVLWGDIKKSAKTCIGAARALWVALHQDFSTVRVVGNDLNQARSRMFEYILRCVLLNKRMSDEYGITVRRNTIIIAKTNSTIEAIAVDPAGEAGGGDDAVCFTEVWGMKSQAHIKMWTELTLSPLKYGKSQRWCESYAGIRGESPLLETLYDRCVVEDGDYTNELGGKKIEKLIESDKGDIVPAPFFTDITGNIFCMWNRAPHVPWQTRDYYDSEKATILEHEFIRVHTNTFITSQQRFISDASLRSCYGPMAKLNQDTILILASDAAYSEDSYALVGITYDIENDLVQLAYEQEWTAPEGGEIDLSQPEKVVRRLAEKHLVLVWVYDPYQLKRTAQSFESPKQDNPIQTYQFIQQGKRSISDKALLDRISTADIILPEDSLTAGHLKNADMKVISSDKVRLVKRQGSSGGPIDLAVALSMGVYVAVSEQHKFPRPVVFKSNTGGETRQFNKIEANESPRIILPSDRTIEVLPSELPH